MGKRVYAQKGALRRQIRENIPGIRAWGKFTNI
jgi:hypothetical protein